MIDSPRIAFRRSTIVWMLALVLLAYAGLFQHQIEHQLGSDESHCAQCLAANHFGHAPPAGLPALLIIPHRVPLPYLPAGWYTAVALQHFFARAPPSPSLA